MKYTNNFNLKKPEATDAYNVNDFNENMDAVDKELKTHGHSNYFNALATYYPSQSVDINADDLTVPVVLIPISSEDDSELYNILKSNFAFIFTVFFDKITIESRRTQVALSYNSTTPRMAMRSYTTAGCFSPWKAVTNDSINPLPIDSGGTGATTVADILKNLGLSTIETDVTKHLANKSNPHSVTYSQTGAAAEKHSHLDLIPKEAVYYSGADGNTPDIDTITDGLMLIPSQFSKGCPVGGSFVYIRQLFYGSTNASALRTQVAFPYGTTSGTVGSGIATRTHLGEGVWTDWEKVGEIITEDISDSFISKILATDYIDTGRTVKTVYKYGNVISGTIGLWFKKEPPKGENVSLFEIAEKYNPIQYSVIPSISTNYVYNEQGELEMPVYYISLGRTDLLKFIMDIYCKNDGLSQISLTFCYICE